MKRIILSLVLLFLGSLIIPGQVQATVQNTINTVTYQGDSVSTSFTFNNNVYLSTDLNVYVQVVSTGITTSLTLNHDYSITLTPISGTTGAYTATINLAGGSNPYGALPTGINLIIVRNIPYTQIINISDYSATPAATWNQALDRSAILSQQLLNLSNRAVLQSLSSTTPITMPAPVIGQYLTWGTNGTIVNSSGTGAQGPPGQGVPTGGTTGQLLTKNSSTNYDTSWASPAASGTVTSVTSANGDITVANTTTTPVITLNSGTTANKIIKLDRSAKLPAVDGSQLTNLPTPTVNWVPNNIQVFTTTGTWTKPGGVSNVYVKVWGAGGGGATNGGGGTGGTSSFAGTTTIQATGGGGGNPSGGVVSGGIGSNGIINLSGGGVNCVNTGGAYAKGGWPPMGIGNPDLSSPSASNAYVTGYAYGGLGGNNTSSCGGAAGGYSEGYTAVSGNVTVTVGTGGTLQGSGIAGGGGLVIVYY